jgi:hypothetical protein
MNDALILVQSFFLKLIDQIEAENHHVSTQQSCYCVLVTNLRLDNVRGYPKGVAKDKT